MGLHQQETEPSSRNKKEALERKYVFWTLYIIDKSISINLGIPCCLPSFDCAVELPKDDPANPFLKQLRARVELASIQEDIYRSLYSSQACRRGDLEASSQQSRLDRELTTWIRDKAELCTDDIGGNNRSSPKNFQAGIALSYTYHSTRILLHRAGNKPSDQEQCREDARACLHIFTRLNRHSASVESAIASRQIIRDHPLIPFFILFANVIRDSPLEDSAQDLHLMLLATDVLQHMELFAKDRSHIPQLLLVASSCCEAAGAIIRKASIIDSSPSTQGFNNSGAASSSAHSSIVNSSVDPWAIDTRMWTSIVPRSPTLIGIAHPSEGPQSWNYNFSHMSEPIGDESARTVGSSNTTGYDVHGGVRMVSWGPGAALI